MKVKDHQQQRTRNEDSKKVFSTLWDSAVARTTGGAILTEGNRITYLKNAEENFPAWLEGIASAESFICIEMYKWDVVGFGQEVRELLIQKLQQGIRVYIIYDWFGSLKAHWKGFFRPLKQQGAQVYAFNKLSLFSIPGILFRDHRKTIIIDGRLSYVSGLCISSDWEGNVEKAIEPWRDSGLAMEGLVSLEVLKAFKDTWSHLSRTSFNEEALPLKAMHEEQALAKARVVATKLFKVNMLRLDLLAITFAKTSIWIADAYFMPTKLYLQLLINAAKDGVDVRILAPCTSDVPWIAAISRTQYRSLLEAGVRIFEWNGSMMHAKTLVVDNRWARVGSTNLNVNSWLANSELDIILEGQESVRPLVLAYLEDIQHSTEMILSDISQSHLKHEKLKLKDRKKVAFLNYRSRLLVRQVLTWGKSLDGMLFTGAEKETVVEKSEAYSFLLISIFSLIVAILFFYLPQTIAYPLAFLSLTVFLTTAHRACQAFYLMKQHQRKRSSTQEEPNNRSWRRINKSK
ncbi:MAG: phosphatidylserine/phosphatidylglycerophosphate/cardiolipin synthase family protein [Neisseriaceae bacterium]